MAEQDVWSQRARVLERAMWERAIERQRERFTGCRPCSRPPRICIYICIYNKLCIRVYTWVYMTIYAHMYPCIYIPIELAGTVLFVPSSVSVALHLPLLDLSALIPPIVDYFAGTGLMDTLLVTVVSFYAFGQQLDLTCFLLVRSSLLEKNTDVHVDCPFAKIHHHHKLWIRLLLFR